MAEAGVKPSAQGRAAPTDGLLTFLIIVLIVGTPTVFYRKMFFPFQLTQLTVFWLLAVGVLFLGAYRVVLVGAFDRGPRLLNLASAVFAVALALSVTLSPQPWAAFSGLTARGAGAFSYLLCLILLHTVFGLGRRRQLDSLVLAFVWAHLTVVFYALLQAYGLDPIDWTGSDLYVGTSVFSTLGNANFSAGFLGLTLPLLLWVPFGSTYSILLRVAGGVGVGLSALALIHFGSFQGNVSGVVALTVLVLWVRQHSRQDWPKATLVALPFAVVILASALVSVAPVLPVVGGVLLLLGLATVMAARWGLNPTNADSCGNQETGGDSLWGGLLGGLVGFVSLGFVFGGRLVEEVRSGLDQRVEYWKVSLSIFQSSPIAGTGLETYPNYFVAHRSVEQAVNWELLLSNAPHSVPLSILSGGGIVLAGGYLAILATVAYYGVRAVRRSVGPSRLFFGAVFSSWAAYQVQSLVSIDVPGLVFVQWVLGGILLAGGVPDSDMRTSRICRSGRRRTQSSGGNSLVVVRGAVGVVAVAGFLFSLGPLTAPIRANMAALRGQQAASNGDLQTAGEEFLYASSLQPSDGFYAERVAEVYELSGLNGPALDEREKIARLQPNDPYAAVRAARAAIRLNQLDLAEQWWDRAVRDDPFGATVLTEAADFYAKTGSEERALELLAEIGRAHV